MTMEGANPPPATPSETEVKLKLRDPEQARALLRGIGAVLGEARHFEDNVLYDDEARGLMRRGGQSDEGMMKALKDAGVDGFVVKMITREKGNPTPVATMELTKVERRSLPGSLFEIPAGYTKQEGMMGAASVMAPPGAGDEMRKALENMTPEQRKQIEEMMKRQQGGR